MATLSHCGDQIESVRDDQQTKFFCNILAVVNVLTLLELFAWDYIVERFSRSLCKVDLHATH